MKKIWDISNPSDPYTMEGEFIPVTIAGVLLGGGKYVITPLDESGHDSENAKEETTCFLFGGFEEWCKKHGIADASKWLDVPENITSVADVLDSVMIGHPSERAIVKSAIEKMSKEDALKWLNERHEKECTSLNDIGKRAKLIANQLRKKIELKKAQLKTEAPNAEN